MKKLTLFSQAEKKFQIYRKRHFIDLRIEKISNKEGTFMEEMREEIQFAYQQGYIDGMAKKKGYVD